MMERKYYNDIDYKPFLFYVVFGVSEDNMQVSKTKHHVDEVPAGIDVMCLNRTNNNDYIENFFRGAIGDIIKERNEELYNICREQDKCVVIQGAAIEDATFDYMRNIVGVMQAFVDNGAVGILDLLTFTLFSPKAYTEKFFEKDINVNSLISLFVQSFGGRDGYNNVVNQLSNITDFSTINDIINKKGGMENDTPTKYKSRGFTIFKAFSQRIPHSS